MAMASNEEEADPEKSAAISGMFSIGRSARAKLDRQIEALAVVAEGGIDADSLWATIRRSSAAVTVVTARDDQGYLGITVSAFCMVSLQPPLVLVCINENSQVLDAISTGGAFAVTVLSSRQELLADMFAGRAPRPDSAFSAIKHRTLVTGAPILEGGLAWLDCRLHQSHPGGDHTIFVGAVVAAGVAADQDDPLLYFGGQYRRLAP
jgi:flavin reductase (DIM6/NTAB) family NADH-FMN oxidoreductase RutF